MQHKRPQVAESKGAKHKEPPQESTPESTTIMYAHLNPRNVPGLLKAIETIKSQLRKTPVDFKDMVAKLIDGHQICDHLREQEYHKVAQTQAYILLKIAQELFCNILESKLGKDPLIDKLKNIPKVYMTEDDDTQLEAKMEAHWQEKDFLQFKKIVKKLHALAYNGPLQLADKDSLFEKAKEIDNALQVLEQKNKAPDLKIYESKQFEGPFAEILKKIKEIQSLIGESNTTFKNTFEQLIHSLLDEEEKESKLLSKLNQIVGGVGYNENVISALIDLLVEAKPELKNFLQPNSTETTIRDAVKNLDDKQQDFAPWLLVLGNLLEVKDIEEQINLDKFRVMKLNIEKLDMQFKVLIPKNETGQQFALIKKAIEECNKLIGELKNELEKPHQSQAYIKSIKDLEFNIKLLKVNFLVENIDLQRRGPEKASKLAMEECLSLRDELGEHIIKNFDKEDEDLPPIDAITDQLVKLESAIEDKSPGILEKIKAERSAKGKISDEFEPPKIA